MPMPPVPPNQLKHLYPHAPKDVADGWHLAWGTYGPKLRRDADYDQFGQQAQLWDIFDVTQKPTTSYGNGNAYTTLSTGELVCHIIGERTPKGERFRYVLPNGYKSRLYRSWVAAAKVAWEVMHAHDPNIGLPLPARVHGLADDTPPTPPLRTPRPDKFVTRPAARRGTPRTPAANRDTATDRTTRTTRKENDHGGNQGTSSGRQASSRAGGGPDFLVLDAAECGDFGADH